MCLVNYIIGFPGYLLSMYVFHFNVKLPCFQSEIEIVFEVLRRPSYGGQSHVAAKKTQKPEKKVKKNSLDIVEEVS